MLYYIPNALILSSLLSSRALLFFLFVSVLYISMSLFFFPLRCSCRNLLLLFLLLLFLLLPSGFYYSKVLLLCWFAYLSKVLRKHYFITICSFCKGQSIHTKYIFTPTFWGCQAETCHSVSSHIKSKCLLQYKVPTAWGLSNSWSVCKVKLVWLHNATRLWKNTWCVAKVGIFSVNLYSYANYIALKLLLIIARSSTSILTCLVLFHIHNLWFVVREQSNVA